MWRLLKALLFDLQLWTLVDLKPQLSSTSDVNPSVSRLVRRCQYLDHNLVGAECEREREVADDSDGNLGLCNMDHGREKPA